MNQVSIILGTKTHNDDQTMTSLNNILFVISQSRHLSDLDFNLLFVVLCNFLDQNFWSTWSICLDGDFEWVRSLKSSKYWTGTGL